MSPCLRLHAVCLSGVLIVSAHPAVRVRQTALPTFLRVLALKTRLCSSSKVTVNFRKEPCAAAPGHLSASLLRRRLWATPFPVRPSHPGCTDRRTLSHSPLHACLVPDVVLLPLNGEPLMLLQSVGTVGGTINLVDVASAAGVDADLGTGVDLSVFDADNDGFV